MKYKSKLSLILIFALVLVIVAPTFAWYEINGYLYADLNNNISKKVDSDFKISYALRDMDEESTTLLGIAPNNDFGEVAIEDATNFASETDWAKNNDGATVTISNIALSEGAVILQGQFGDIVTGSGGGAGDQVEETDPEDPQDNNIPFNSSNVSVVTPLSDVTPIEDYDISVPSGESDNRFNITGNFSAEEDKLVGVTVSITPKDSENEYDVIAAKNVNYAIYYQKTHQDAVEITDGSNEKIVFANNAFKYIADGTSKIAVSQNGYFLAEEGATYSVVAVVWLDGFGDAKAESGAFTFDAHFNDLANITSSIGTNNVVNGEILNSIETEDLIIPGAFYSGTETVQITKIADGAFRDKDYLNSVVIPDTVTTIGEMAFYGCKNLQTVHFGNKLEEIDQFAFTNTNLTSATFANPYGWTPDILEMTPVEIADLLKNQLSVWSKQ